MASDLADSGEARPRWRFRFSLLALLIFVTLACLFLAWIVQPTRATATALFQVYSTRPNVLENDPGPYDQREFDLMCKTQIALIKSYVVLQAAIRDPKIASLSLFRGVSDPVAWLQDHLEVEFPQQSEILAIRLRGTEQQANDLRMIVDAVAKAYRSEMIGSERQKLLVRRDALARSLNNLNEELNREMGLYFDMARELGLATSENADVQQQLNLQRLARVDDELMRLESEQLKLEVIGGDGNSDEKTKLYERQIARLRERQKELEKKIESRSTTSVELTTRKAKIEHLQKIASDMSIKLEMMDVEAEAPEQTERIQQIQPAIIEIE